MRKLDNVTTFLNLVLNLAFEVTLQCCHLSLLLILGLLTEFVLGMPFAAADGLVITCTGGDF